MNWKVLSIAMALGLASSCSSGSKGPPCVDPPGTVTIEMSSGSYIDFLTGSLNTPGAGSLSFIPLNFTMDNNSNADGVVDVGAVSCLGEVTTQPVSGYTHGVAATPGHGYVLKMKNGSFTRMYADSWVECTGGTICGVLISWQYPF